MIITYTLETKTTSLNMIPDSKEYFLIHYPHYQFLLLI